MTTILLLQGANMAYLGKRQPEIYGTTPAADERIDGLLMNPAGFTYAGYALRDCLRSMQFPCVEVHMTNIDKRGFKSVTAETARGVIAGFGLRSYLMGLDALLALIEDDKAVSAKKN